MASFVWTLQYFLRTRAAWHWIYRTFFAIARFDVLKSGRPSLVVDA